VTQFWQRRTNVWPKVTSPRMGPERLTSEPPIDRRAMVTSLGSVTRPSTSTSHPLTGGQAPVYDQTRKGESKMTRLFLAAAVVLAGQAMNIMKPSRARWLIATALMAGTISYAASTITAHAQTAMQNYGRFHGYVGTGKSYCPPGCAPCRHSWSIESSKCVAGPPGAPPPKGRRQ
jgi:hypothetical protein